jgi:lipopolysaccharide export system protein LptA
MRPTADTTARLRALPLAVAAIALSLTGAASARDSDRNQPMDIDAGRQEGTLNGNSVNVLSGGVVITQGTLDIRADRADIHQSGGEVVRAVLTGKQAVLKQQMDDGSPMTAKADRIDYEMTSDVIVLTGNYTITTPRGTTSGQRLTYNLKSGRVESGGDSGRVKMTILPKSGRASAPPPKPATQGTP